MKHLILDADALGNHWTLWERITSSDYVLSDSQQEKFIKDIWMHGYMMSIGRQFPEDADKFNQQMNDELELIKHQLTKHIFRP